MVEVTRSRARHAIHAGQAMRRLMPQCGYTWLLAVTTLGFGCQQQLPTKVTTTQATQPTPPATSWHQRPQRGTWIEPAPYVAEANGAGRFRLAAKSYAAPLIVSSSDHPGVLRAAQDLQLDIQRVTQVQPILSKGVPPTGGREMVLIGTLGQAPIIDQLVRAGKLNVTNVVGRWETFLITEVQQPLPNLDQALVIVGSDPRGTMFGIYDLSAQIGVSPWHYWDDVPVKQKPALFVLPGQHTWGEPAVKYRGLFINDESPSLDRWVWRAFGPGKAPGWPRGFNHHFYAKVFELMLRLKANYLWPAVWSRAFAEDDPENQATADSYGIVMGTSHEAPMNRAIGEWNRHAVPAQRDPNGNLVARGHDAYGGTGEWSFRRNREAVTAYFTDGAKRIGSSEVIVTLGMRGNGDTALGDGAGIELMQNIVATQRQILSGVTKRDLQTLPQVWTLYKEVQDYWDRGLRAPDDVTIVWCDDNWGNLRKLPDLNQPERMGGYGLYYHFDYVGESRNYKWVNTNLLSNIWEQLHLAYVYGVDQLWMVNVGDLKNLEFPTEFFLNYAYSPERWPLERISEWERRWAQEQFGPTHASEIAEILHSYEKLASRRKPELLNRKIAVQPEARHRKRSRTCSDLRRRSESVQPDRLSRVRTHRCRVARACSHGRASQAAAAGRGSRCLLSAGLLSGAGKLAAV